MSEVLAEEEQKAREPLQQAIEDDDVDLLHYLIVKEPELLDRVSKHPFPNTPLHIAAAKGKFKVAMEMVILRPSFAWKLNAGGYSPMHLALQCKQYPIVRALMTLHPELIRVRGREGITPLHYITGEKGEIELELLAKFLRTCKSSIEELTSQCETAVHIAVKNQNLKAFNVLLGWLKQVHLTKILNRKDKDGNTVLHVAAELLVAASQQPQVEVAVSEQPQVEVAASQQPQVEVAVSEQPQVEIEFVQMIKSLVGYVDVNAENFHKETALKIFQRHPKRNEKSNQDVVKLLRGEGYLTIYCFAFFSVLASLFYVQDKSAREVILVVATLVATATYQAALNPPGGYWQDSSSNSLSNSTGIGHEKAHQAGKMILSGSDLYRFTLLNSMTFLISMCTILAAIVPLFPDTHMVCMSMFILAINYFLSLKLEFPNSNEVGENLISKFFMAAMYVFFALSALIWVKRRPVRQYINATRRHIGNF